MTAPFSLSMKKSPLWKAIQNSLRLPEAVSITPGEPILRHASMTVRIPTKHLEAFLQAAQASGNVVSQSETTEDVTLQYSDVESRKKSLEIEQERIWALLEKAESLESVIALEERLSEILL